nr:reverse transcriptase domain-containing protein [Tanacetum cinerariifolium]
MQTHSSSRLVSNPSSNPTLSTNPNPKGRNHRRSKQRIKEFNLDELSPPIVMMADQRTMAQLLQAPTDVYEDAIFILVITADNFELKHGLLTLVQNKQFFGHDKEDPHAHIRYFNKITSTLKFPNVLNTEAWDRLKDLLRACPHHGFLELHQLNTFYNALNSKYQDSLNSAAGGNFLDKMPRECLAIIKSKSKVCYSRNKPVVAKVSMNTSTSGISPDVAELKDMVKALLLDKKSQNQAPATVKAVKFVNTNSASTSSSGTLPSNTIANPRCDLKAITTRSGVSYDGLQIPPSYSFLPKVVENKPMVTKDTVHPTNNGRIEDVQPQVVQSKSPILTSEPVNSPTIESVIYPVSALRPNVRPSIPYPSRMQDQKLYLNFNITFVDALILMPKFGPSIKSLLTNKDKLCELARTPLNEHCLAVLLKKLPEKLGDPDKFLIPCNFPGKAECLALADLGVSINLMPLSMWNKLSLPDLTTMCMTLELVDRSISRLVGVAEDVYVIVGTFHFLTNFVVVDFDVDARVPLILQRSFLKTGRALIDVFEGELTLRVGKGAITFNLDQTSRYSANYNEMTAKRIDVIDMACEEYSQEVLGFSDVITSGIPTPYYDPIVSTTSLTLTVFENCDFLLEEVDAFLALNDDPTSLEVDQSYLDPKGGILLLKAFLNDDPLLTPPNQGNYLPEVELKDLPPHLEYTFLEGDDKLPVIIAKDLSVEEKTALIMVLKSHKRAIAWKLSDIKVFGNSFQSCLSHLERMLKRCEDTNLCLNWEKSHFTVKEGIVLGHKIFKQGIEVDKAKVDVITKLPHPTTVKGIRSFLGHVSFYRRFIKDFSKIARPMTRLLEKDTIFHFSKKFVEAFETLKIKLTKAPILIAPDWDMPFELMYDASDFAIGAVLGQRQDKHFRLIHYASKNMAEAESNYTTTKKEMLAVVYAFKKFRSYLIMNKSIVYTDHSALKYLFAKKDSKERLLRWVLLLQEFTFKVIGTKGAENLAADHLSWLENPHQNVLDPKEINESFPLMTLNLVSTRGDSSTSWFADFANYHPGNFVVKSMSS